MTGVHDRCRRWAFAVAAIGLLAVVAPVAMAADEAARELLGRHGAVAKTDDAGSIVEVKLRVGEPVPADLLAALEKLPRLERLVAAGSGLNDKALVAVGRLKGLRQLDLRDCPVTNAGLAHLGGLRELVALRLSGKSGACTVDDDGMQHVAALGGLRVLMLDFLWVGKDGLEKLVGLERLEELTLAQSLVQDDALPVIARFPALRRLRLARTSVSGAGLAEITKLGRLEDLDLGEAAQLDDAALVEVGKLTTLKRLNLWRVPVGDEGIGKLSGLTRLEWLNLDNTRLTDGGLAALAGMTKLATLHVGSTALSNAAVPQLVRLAALKDLGLARTAVDASGVAALRKQLPDTVVRLEAAEE